MYQVAILQLSETSQYDADPVTTSEITWEMHALAHGCQTEAVAER